MAITYDEEGRAWTVDDEGNRRRATGDFIQAEQDRQMAELELKQIEADEAKALQAEKDADAAHQAALDKIRSDADAKIAALPKFEAPEPDYKGLWNTYSGWLDNINQRNIGELADVRARLSAAGASPDLIKMQTEHFESQRKKDITGIQDTETYRTLQSGLDKATDRAGDDTVDTYFTRKFGAFTSGPPSQAAVSASNARAAGSTGAAATAAPGGGSGTIASPWYDDTAKSLL